MYKKILFCFTLFLFLLTGCTDKFPIKFFSPPEISTEFNSKAEITYGELTVNCDVSNMKQGITSVSVNKPENLSGLAYKWVNSNLTVSYKELSIQTEDGFLPQKNFAQIFYNILKLINIGSDSVFTFVLHDGQVSEFTGKTPYGICDLTVLNSTGEITKIEIKDISFSADFELDPF